MIGNISGGAADAYSRVEEMAIACFRFDDRAEAEEVQGTIRYVGIFH